jgi:hypothetical protein
MIVEQYLGTTSVLINIENRLDLFIVYISPGAEIQVT